MNRELIVQHQDGSSHTLTLDGRRLTLGRAADNDLPYPDDPVLSRRHLALEFEEFEWFVEDLNSKNGTLLNGERLSGRRRLQVGDRITVGRVTLLFDDPVEAADRTVLFVPDDTLPTSSTASVRTNLEEVVGEDSDGLEAALKSPAIAGTPRVQALLEAGRELADHRPLPELFKVILELAANSVGATRGVVLTLEGAQLVPRAARGEHFVISRAVRDRVIGGKESLLILDASQDEMLRGSMTIVSQKVKSLMAVPLQTVNKVTGLIYLDSPEFIRPFTSEDLTLLTVMANIAAVRIENARLVEVEQAERMMKKELEQAAEIQRGLLPKDAPKVDGLELAGFSVACRSVGGDYFDYLELSDGRIGLLVGDVAGKGLSAAMLMSNLQARVQILSEDVEDLSAMMSRLNKSICGNCPGNRFITFFLGICDPRTGELWYSNAGHNPPYLMRSDGDIEMLTVGGPVLGILKVAPYRAEKLTMQRGDVLVMFSDGVTEARSPDDEEYGEERLLAELSSLRRATAQEIRKVMQDSVERFMGTAPAADDITLVVARKL